VYQVEREATVDKVRFVRVIIISDGIFFYKFSIIFSDEISIETIDELTRKSPQKLPHPIHQFSVIN
jgi:hypothetical protein